MKDDNIIPHSPSAEEYKKEAEKLDKVGVEDFSHAHDNPFELFKEWFALANKKEVNDANAVNISTVDEDGMPDARMVLLKDFDERGFVFYTNLESSKGQQLLSSKKCAMVFHWKSLRRQVRIRGIVELVSDTEADYYFASRARESQIGAWASKQSHTMHGIEELMKNVAEYGVKFGFGKIERPPHWSGFRIVPLRIEFWQDRPFRLHKRLEYTRSTPSDNWVTRFLFP